MVSEGDVEVVERMLSVNGEAAAAVRRMLDEVRGRKGRVVVGVGLDMVRRLCGPPFVVRVGDVDLVASDGLLEEFGGGGVSVELLRRVQVFAESFRVACGGEIKKSHWSDLWWKMVEVLEAAGYVRVDGDVAVWVDGGLEVDARDMAIREALSVLRRQMAGHGPGVGGMEAMERVATILESVEKEANP